MNAMLTITVLLLAAVVCVPLAHRIGLGALPGYLLAGVLVGPSGFAAITDVTSILHLSEWGVVLMLFIIGLELEPRRLWGMRREVFGAGSVQLAVSGLLLVGLLWLVMRPAGTHAWVAIGVVGMALALSSTAVAMQLLQERELLHAPAGHSALGILLFQDVAAIPLLVFVSLMGGPGEGNPPSFWAALGAVAVVWVAVRLRVFSWVARTRLRELFTACALLAVVGSAELMQSAGLSIGLGGFLAGVILSESSFRKALETDLEPFKGLLLGLFFIAVGMSIDLNVLRVMWLQVAVGVLALLAAKMAVLYCLARVLGLPRQHWLLFAVVLAQGGEFGFVVFGAALDGELLSAEQNGLLSVIVAISMGVAPLLLKLVDMIPARAGGQADALPPPAPDHAADVPVIVAGFGRAGQLITRLLYARDWRVTVLDLNPDRINLLNQFGYRVHYGDATRLDMLRAAGAQSARVLVVTVDTEAASLAVVELARTHFPHLQIVARARGLGHDVALRRLGVTVIERDASETALRMGRRVLQTLGVDAWEARRAADQLRAATVAATSALALDGEELDSVEHWLERRGEVVTHLTESFQAERRVQQGSREGW